MKLFLLFVLYVWVELILCLEGSGFVYISK